MKFQNKLLGIQDLRAGMVLTCRDGRKYVTLDLNGTLKAIAENNTLDLWDYAKDSFKVRNMDGKSRYDIIKIETLNNEKDAFKLLNGNFSNLKTLYIEKFEKDDFYRTSKRYACKI